MGTTATKAKSKYNAKSYDRVYLTVKKGEKDIIEAAATAAGMSVNAYINEAIQERIERDKNK